jgi:alpha-tubulin suppressor-like RCC1 family protein
MRFSDILIPLRAEPFLECWGQNAAGQLGIGSTGAAQLIPERLSLRTTMEFAAGSSHTCALADDERVRCWGRNDAGQLGTGTTAAATSPALVVGPIGSITARGLAAGLNHSCAWRADGNVACWGRNGSGAIGDGTFVDRLTPVAVTLERTPVLSMAAGDHHTCAAATLGTIQCWGQNVDRQVNPLLATSFLPTPSSFTAWPVANLAAGSRFTILGRPLSDETVTGATDGWGANDASQLGNIEDFDTSTLAFVSAGPMPLPVSVAAGVSHSCALAADGTVRCWGSNQFGQLGIGSVAQGPFATPQQVLGVFDAVSIASGPFHTCVVLVDGRVQCWGRNDFRQLGDGTTTDRRFATPVPGISAGGAVALTLGRTHSCALTPSGGVRCWGRNNQGQLGDTSLTDRSSPVFVQQATVFFLGQPLLSQSTTLNQIVGIVAGQTHTCARRVSGRVLCWGSNVDGQIGDGTTANRPIAIGVASFTANMAPAVTLSPSNRHLEVTALLNCEVGARFRVEISATQGDAAGTGQAQGRCSGALERIPVRITAHGPEQFHDGDATASAVFEVTRNGRTIDLQEWTRKLQIAAVDTETPR